MAAWKFLLLRQHTPIVRCLDALAWLGVGFVRLSSRQFHSELRDSNWHVANPKAFLSAQCFTFQTGRLWLRQTQSPNAWNISKCHVRQRVHLGIICRNDLYWQKSQNWSILKLTSRLWPFMNQSRALTENGKDNKRYVLYISRPFLLFTSVWSHWCFMAYIYTRQIADMSDNVRPLQPLLFRAYLSDLHPVMYRDHLYREISQVLPCNNRTLLGLRIGATSLSKKTNLWH